jgi:hypothetical protein
VSLFLDALSDAATQMTANLTSVARAFEAGWQNGLETLLASPAALFYVAAFATMVVLVIGGLRGVGRAGYQRGRFLTANEKSFLMTLDTALGQNYRAFAQVRLAELANPTLGANPAARRQALNGVMAKSVDFVICDILTLDPVAAIEVDDRSHLLPERRQRDAFVNAVFLEIGLPLMRVKARRAYSVDELRTLSARAGLFIPVPLMEGMYP